MCRMYPVLWQNRKRGLHFFLDTSCPLAHMLPLRDFANWGYRGENRTIIKLMDDLDFKRKEPQYINLTVISQQADVNIVNDPHIAP